MNMQRKLRRNSRSQTLKSLAKKRFSISSQVLRGLMIAIDSLVILSSGLLLYDLIVEFGVPSYYAAAVAFVWLVSIMLMNFAGLYEFDAVTRPIAFIDKIIIVFVTTFSFLLAAAFALKMSAEYSRIWTGSFALLACAATIIVRVIAAQIIKHLADRNVFSRNVVIVGSGDQMWKLLDIIEKSEPRFITLLGVFSKAGKLGAHSGHFTTLGTPDELPSFVRNHNVDDVIICMPWSADDHITSMINTLRELPVNVYLGADLIGFRLPIRRAPDHFEELPLVEVMGRPLAGWGGIQKAVLDYSLGTLLTMLLLPLMTLIVIAIRLESKGPALVPAAALRLHQQDVRDL